MDVWTVETEDLESATSEEDGFCTPPAQRIITEYDSSKDGRLSSASSVFASTGSPASSRYRCDRESNSQYGELTSTTSVSTTTCTDHDIDADRSRDRDRCHDIPSILADDDDGEDVADGESLLVSCPNRLSGCKWRGVLKDLVRHMFTCEYAMAICPNMCFEVIRRRDMREHVELYCPYRPSSAPGADASACSKPKNAIEESALLQKDSGDHGKDLGPGIGKSCNGHVMIEILSSQTRKTVDIGTSTSDKAAQELSSRSKVSSVVGTATDNANTCVSSSAVEDWDEEPASKCLYSIVGCKAKLRRKEAEKHQQENLLQHLHMALQTVLVQRCRLDRYRRLIAEARTSVCPLKFKLSSFSSHLQQQQGSVWFSKPFYAHRDGFKLTMAVCTTTCTTGGGNASQEIKIASASSEATNLSVFIYIRPGENDSSLDWPFSASVYVCLLNQLTNSGHHLKRISFPCKNSASCQCCNRVIVGKGGREMMSPKGRGKLQFIALSKLGPHDLDKNGKKQVQYLKDDSLYFAISVQSKRPWLAYAS